MFNERQLECFLEEQIKALRKLNVGIQNKPVIVTPVVPSRTTSLSIDHIYNIKVDSGGGSKSWQIIFDPDHLTHSPDIVFDDENLDFTPSIYSMTSYESWSISNKGSLKNTISEIYQLYVVHQYKRLKEIPKLSLEFQELLSQASLVEDIELSFVKNGPGTYNDTVKFTIPLNIDYADLPPYFSTSNPGPDESALCLSFESPNQSSVKATVQISPAIESAFGGVTNLRIPSYGSSTLLEYVTKIEKLFTATVDNVSKKYRKRKLFLQSFMASMCRSQIEYDNERYFEASFLCSVHNYYFVLYVVLSEQYPMEKPILYIQSIYQFQEKMTDVTKDLISEYPYSPFGSNEENISNIKNHLIEYVKHLKE